MPAATAMNHESVEKTRTDLRNVAIVAQIL